MSGQPPGIQSGSHTRHLDRKLKTQLRSFHTHKLKLPLYKRKTLGRKIYDTPVLAAYEELEDELNADISFKADLHDALVTKQLPESYVSHPMVVESDAAEEVVPLGVFVDGVRFQKKDTCIGFWMYCVITQVKHLLINIKKSQLCKCGCKGWCAIWVALDYLRFNLECLAKGRYPEKPHACECVLGDCKFDGTRLQHKYCCIEVKTDWAEYGSTMALPTWGSALFPCKDCCIDKAELHRVNESFATMLPWEPTREADYTAACNRCEVAVALVTKAELAEIRASLRRTLHVKKLGRVMIKPIPRFGLLRGDMFRHLNFVIRLGWNVWIGSPPQLYSGEASSRRSPLGEIHCCLLLGVPSSLSLLIYYIAFGSAWHKYG